MAYSNKPSGFHLLRLECHREHYSHPRKIEIPRPGWLLHARPFCSSELTEQGRASTECYANDPGGNESCGDEDQGRRCEYQKKRPGRFSNGYDHQQSHMNWNEDESITGRFVESRLLLCNPLHPRELHAHRVSPEFSFPA